MTSLNSLLNIWLFLLLLRILDVKAESGPKEPPCNYWDTVTLERAIKFPNGSYRYQDIIVPANETWTYDYRMLVRDVKINATLHVRGCICKFRACISICCPNSKEYIAESNDCGNKKLGIDKYMNVTTEQGNTIRANISSLFINQYGRPCGDLFCLKDNYIFTLFENGSISYEDDGTHILSKNEYCLSPSVSNSFIFYYPWACTPKQKSSAVAIARKGIVMITSVPFMLLTISAIVLAKKLALSNIATCFYLLALSLGFSTLGYITLARNINPTICSILGYTTYFAFIASYSWLAVISFELFCHLPKIDCTTSTQHTTLGRKSLKIYSLFGWGLPTFLLVLVLFAQHQDWDDIYKPNIGGKIYCYFDNKGYNMMIYFYGPSIVLISFNILMFVLTIMQMSGRSDCQDSYKKFKPRTGLIGQKLKPYLEKYGTYARLSLVTGVAWIFEILSYCFPGNAIFQTLFYLVEFQGYFIFFSVIFLEQIRKGLKERFDSLFIKGNANNVYLTPKLHKRKNSSVQRTSL